MYQLVDAQDGEKTYRRVHCTGNAAKQLVKEELVLRKISGGDSAGKKQRRKERRGRELSEEGTEEGAEEGREEDRPEETRVDARRKDTLRAGKLQGLFCGGLPTWWSLTLSLARSSQIARTQSAFFKSGYIALEACTGETRKSKLRLKDRDSPRGWREKPV